MTRPAPVPCPTPSPRHHGLRHRALAYLAVVLVCLAPAMGGLLPAPTADAATTYTVTRTVPAATNPIGVVADVTHGIQYVLSDQGMPSSRVVPINDSTGAQDQPYLLPQVPTDLAIDATLNRLYVSEYPRAGGVGAVGAVGPIVPAEVTSPSGPGRIAVFDASTHTQVQELLFELDIPVAIAARAPNPVDRYLYAAMTPGPVSGSPPFLQILTLDPGLDFFKTINLGETPTNLAVDVNSGTAYVTTTTGLPLVPGNLRVIDPFQEPPTNVPIAVGINPVDVAVDISGHRAYVVNGGSESVSVINLDTNTVVSTVPVPGARRVAVDPSVGEVYVTAYTQNAVRVLRAGDLAPLSTVPLNAADAVAVDPTTHRAFVTTGDGQLATITRTVTVPPSPATTGPRPTFITVPPAPPQTPPIPTTATTAVARTTVAPTTSPTTTVPLPPTTTATATTAPAPPLVVPTTTARSEKSAAQFIDALPSPAHTDNSIATVAKNAFITMLFLALLSLPINVVNGVAETNAERLGGEAAGLGPRFRVTNSTGWMSGLPIGSVLVLAAVVSAVLYGFLQPSFGIDGPSLALVVGVALAVLVFNAVQRLTQIAYLKREFNVGGFLRLLPGFGLVAVGCVAVSRLIGLQPGLLLGPLATVGLRDPVQEDNLGKSLALAYVAVAVFGVVAWFSRSSVLGLFDANSFAGEVAGVAWTTLVVACTETVAFNMIPLRFLDGSEVFGWSKAAWAGLALFGTFGFVHVLVNPSNGASSFEGRTTYLAILLGVYLLLAAGFWAYVRLRASSGPSAPPPSPPPPGRPAPPSAFNPPPSPGQTEDSMQATWREMQGSGWPQFRP